MELKTLLSDFAEALRKVIEHLAFGVPEFSSATCSLCATRRSVDGPYRDCFSLGVRMSL